MLDDVICYLNEVEVPLLDFDECLKSKVNITMNQFISLLFQYPEKFKNHIASTEFIRFYMKIRRVINKYFYYKQLCIKRPHMQEQIAHKIDLNIKLLNLDGFITGKEKIRALNILNLELTNIYHKTTINIMCLITGNFDVLNIPEQLRMILSVPQLKEDAFL